MSGRVRPEGARLPGRLAALWILLGAAAAPASRAQEATPSPEDLELRAAVEAYEAARAALGQALAALPQAVPQDLLGGLIPPAPDELCQSWQVRSLREVLGELRVCVAEPGFLAAPERFPEPGSASEPEPQETWRPLDVDLTGLVPRLAPRSPLPRLRLPSQAASEDGEEDGEEDDDAGGGCFQFDCDDEDEPAGVLDADMIGEMLSNVLGEEGSVTAINERHARLEGEPEALARAQALLEELRRRERPHRLGLRLYRLSCAELAELSALEPTPAAARLEELLQAGRVEALGRTAVTCRNGVPLAAGLSAEAELPGGAGPVRVGWRVSGVALLHPTRPELGLDLLLEAVDPLPPSSSGGWRLTRLPLRGAAPLGRPLLLGGAASGGSGVALVAQAEELP